MIMLPLFMECVCIPDPTPVVFTHLWPDKKKKRKHPERKYFNIFFGQLAAARAASPRIT